MWRWAERLRAPVRRDEGFSLVEVVVSLGVLMIVVAALLPQLVVGIRATSTARLVTQAKGVAHAELERMRNLPYHVSADAGEFRDVLDYYYTGLNAANAPICTTSGGGFAPPQAGWAGYVAPGAARCSYEPATGAFYRTVRQVPAGNGMAPFTVVVSTQFLSGATPPQPVTPPAGYSTASPLGGRPPASQIGVTATVLYTDRTSLRPTSTYTQVMAQPPVTTRVRAEASATAVEAGSVTPTGVPVSLSAGLLGLAGSLTHASTVTANLTSTSAGLATGETGAGAAETATAPPGRAALVELMGPGALGATGCVHACWGGTRVDAPAVSGASGLPTAGTPSAPGQALITDLANGGITFGNAPVSDYRPGLKLSPPLVRLDSEATATPSGVTSTCELGTTGSSSYVASSGYLRTTATDAAVEPGTVEACAVARASTVSLFPTEFAPRGVVLIELSHASARCRVTGVDHTPTPTYDYRAVVRYWNGTDYQVAGTVTPATTSDPLQGVPMTTSVGGGKVLGDYVASWSGLTAAGVTASASGGEATVKLPGVVTLASQPVRPAPDLPEGDPSSVVSLTVGALGCSAVDAR